MNPKSPLLRSPVAIQIAHDVLARVITDEALRNQVIDAKDQQRARGVLEALCWVAGHDSGPCAVFLSEVTMRLEKLGYQPYLKLNGKE